MVKRVAVLVATAVVMAGCSKAVPEGCPELVRSPLIPMNLMGSDLADTRMNEDLKVDDCLNEYAGKFAQGKSSDENVARAAVVYCGSYGTEYDFADDDRARDEDRTQRDALAYVVASRALHCPPPLHRKLVGKEYVLPKRSTTFSLFQRAALFGPVEYERRVHQVQEGVPDAVVRAYQRAKFMDLRRKLLDAWGAFVDGDSNVIRLATAQ